MSTDFGPREIETKTMGLDFFFFKLFSVNEKPFGMALWVCGPIFPTITMTINLLRTEANQ